MRIEATQQCHVIPLLTQCYRHYRITMDRQWVVYQFVGFFDMAARKRAGDGR